MRTLMRLLIDLRERKEALLSALADRNPGSGVCRPLGAVGCEVLSMVDRDDDEVDTFLDAGSERREALLACLFLLMDDLLS